MKILNVVDLMNEGSAGGSSTRTYHMSQSLARLGEKVEILTTNWDIDINFTSKISGVKWHSINAIFFRYLFPLTAYAWLERNIRDYDIVHISKNWSILASLAAKIAHKNNIPYIFSGMGLVDTKSRSKLLKYVFKKIFTIPTIKNAATCIAVTEEEKLDLMKVGVSENKIRVIPNGIVPNDFLSSNSSDFRKKYLLGNKKIILFIGRMDPIKGVDLIIDAYNINIKDLEDWILVLVGTKTAYRKEMEEKVLLLNLSKHILFLDPIFGADKSDAYHAAEFIVIPSIKDAMTIIAPEAACCKRPVLITTSSQFPSLAICGGAIEVPPTIDGLSNGLKILTNTKVDLNCMGRKGYEYVSATYNWDKLAIDYKNLFIDALSSHNAAQ